LLLSGALAPANYPFTGDFVNAMAPAAASTAIFARNSLLLSRRAALRFRIR